MIASKQLREGQFFWILILLVLLIFGNIFLPAWTFEGFHYQLLNDASNTLFSPAIPLGEFSFIVADYLFFAAEHYWHEGRWYLVPPAYELILKIQPQFLDVWSLLGWFYAFNSSGEIAHQAGQEASVQKGIATLRKGLVYHAQHHDLYFDLAWIYFKKLENYQQALFYLEKSVQYPHPVHVERLLALSLYRLGRTKDAELVWVRYLEKYPNDAFAKLELDKIRKLLS